jgi:dCTP deaminase
MMVTNGGELLRLAPIENMASAKILSHGVSFGLSEAGYDIRIKQGILFTRNWWGRRIVEVIDPDRVDIGHPDLIAVTRKKGRFALASAIERFQMPPTHMAIVHDKSSWARYGLSVFNTVIEPGWKGYLTLELAYKGQGSLFVPPGSGIAQVIFHEVSQPMFYKGRYQDQPNRPIPPINSGSRERSF